MSRDNTLLARLAFADSDKKNPLHDLACHYIAQPEVACRVYAERSFSAASFEHPISKGQGQYKTTIGFVDVVLGFSGHAILVEVKIGPVELGDALRQINLYREYAQGYDWIFVAAFPMTEFFENGLRAAGIDPFQLGDDFKKYVEANTASAAPGKAQAL